MCRLHGNIMPSFIRDLSILGFGGGGRRVSEPIPEDREGGLDRNTNYSICSEKLGFVI